MRIRKNLLCILAVATLLAAGCSKKAGSASAGSTTPSPSPTPTPGTSYPFEVVLTSQFDTGGTVTTEADCTIPAGSPAGTVNACNVTIPEGRLHYSRLTWYVNVGTESVTNSCEIVHSYFYYYMASRSAGFNPSWVTASLDCTTVPTPKDCYSGVASDIVPGFPLFTSMVFYTYSQMSANFTAHSAHEMGRLSNRWTVNNNSSPATAVLQSNFATPGKFFGDAYVGGGYPNYVDYYFVCADRYDDPVYGFTMIITDQDLTGVYPNVSQGNSSINQYPDWDATGWGL